MISQSIKLACIILLSNASMSIAQSLVYRPVNPAFGGDTFNYQWLLSSAQSQNQLEEQKRDAFSKSPLDDFESSLNRQILNKLTRELINEIFGEGGDLQDGTFEFGTLTVDIASETDGINIDIYNSQDGSQTNIIVPYY